MNLFLVYLAKKTPICSDSFINLTFTRHQQAAGLMTATYGRLTEKTGACLSTLGPGATNFVTAVAFAQLGGTPMLMVTSQKLIKSSKQGHFQIIDAVKNNVAANQIHPSNYQWR